MTVYLFAGPSLPRTVREGCKISGAKVLPPVAAGDLFRLPIVPGDVVAIIDGFFHRRPAVRHKEILDLLAQGVHIHGAASMGALRAAELAHFGMIGHGRIFTDYHSGTILADDEVALLHGTEAEDYELYTEALVNIRYALDNAADRNILNRATARKVLEISARLPFTERTRESILDAAVRAGIGKQDLASVRHVLCNAPDIKQEDARILLEAVLNNNRFSQTMEKQPWELRETLHLRQWRSAACGSHDPLVGWIADNQVHRLAQVLAEDYPTFREKVALQDLAARHITSTTGLQEASDAVSFRPPKNLSTIGEVNVVHSSQASILPPEAVLKELRNMGLLPVGAESDPGLDQWCTKAEKNLPDAKRTAKAAARALFPTAALAWHDPFLAELKTSGVFSKVYGRLVDCLHFHYKLKQQKPTLQLQQLRPEKMLEYFSLKWTNQDVCDTAIERGFATIEDFLDAARPFYLYDKTHPHNEPLFLLESD